MSHKVQHGTEVLAMRKRVKYEGTSVVKEGMPVAYNYDATANILGYDKGAGGQPECQSTPNTTAEGSQNEGKFLLVEDVTAANSFAFAGVVTSGSWVGETGDGSLWLEIFVPNGACVPVWTDKSVTVKDPMYLEPGQLTMTDLALGAHVGTFMETVDRSSTNGIVLALLDRPLLQTSASMILKGRTAVQLPTDAIWRNFDLDTLERTFGASVLRADFSKAQDNPTDTFVDTTSTVNMLSGAAGIGELELDTSADNEAAEVQWNCPIDLDGGPWAFECRIKCENVTNDKAFVFAGLFIAAAPLSGDIIADNGAAMTDGGCVGFQVKAADGDVFDFIYDDAGQTQNEHDADYVTATADTYNTLGMYYNGTTIQGYLDGVLTGTAISASDIAAADFPDDLVMVPTVCNKGGAADDKYIMLDWIQCAQLDA